jgi:hypothetical protein
MEEKKKDWFDAEYVAQRQAEKDAKVAREEAGRKKAEKVFGFAKGVFKKVAVA